MALLLLLLGGVGWFVFGEAGPGRSVPPRASVPDVGYGRSPEASPNAATSGPAEAEPVSTFALTVTDEAGALLREATATASTRDGDVLRVPQAALLCVEVEAPGFLATDLCPPPGGFGPEPRALTLERARIVELRCDDGSGAAPCPLNLIARCLSPDTPDFGRCAPPTCPCPDDPGARVLAMGRGWSGAEAEIVAGVATLRRTGTGGFVFTGEGMQDSTVLVERELGDRTFTVGRAAVGEDGTARIEGLPPGTYAAIRVSEDYLWARHLQLNDGETRVVALEPAPGRRVRVEGHPLAVLVEGGGLRWQSLADEGPIDANVPAGARLTVFVEAGCCAWTDPPSAVTCSAPSPGACPDNWLGLSL